MTTILQTIPTPEPQDSILALAPKAEETPDNNGFDKVFEQTAHEEARENKGNEKPEKSSASTERGPVLDRADAKLKAQKQNAGEVRKIHNATKPAQLGQANVEEAGSDNATEAKRSAIQPAKSIEPKKSSKVTSQKQAVDSDLTKGVHREKISNEQKAQRALKQGQVRQAAKVKAREKAQAKARANQAASRS